MNTKIKIATLLVFFVPYLLYSLSLVGGMSSGDLTNYALTKALVDQKTYQLDSYRDLIRGDYALSPDGKIVADREPGISYLAIPFYLLGKILRPVTYPPYGGLHSAVNEESRIQLWTYQSVIFVTCLGYAVFFHLAGRITSSRSSRWLTLITIAFGTLMWKYGASFSRHPFVAVSFLVTATSFIVGQQKKDPRYLLLCGISLGLAAITDYATWPAILLAVLVLLLPQSSRAKLRHLGLGLAPFLLAAFVYNTVVFHHPISSPHSHEASFEYMKTFLNNFRTPLHWGIFLQLFSCRPIPRQAIPWVLQNEFISQQISAYWAMTWTYKGIFVQTPPLFLAIYGWFKLTRHKKGGRKATLFPLALFLGILIPMSLLTQFWGPNHYDTRHLLAIVPLLLIGLLGLKDWFTKPLTRVLVITTTYLAILFSWQSTLTNHGPNFSGDRRYSIARIILAPEPWTTKLLNCFPNLPNLLLIACFSLILYLLAVKPLLDYLAKHDL